jgi:hypothetical protein
MASAVKVSICHKIDYKKIRVVVLLQYYNDCSYHLLSVKIIQRRKSENWYAKTSIK